MKSVILQPLITEKNTYRQSDGVYVFSCAIDAEKEDIKKSVENFFNVKVTKVNTSIVRKRAKRTRFGLGNVSYAKKAFVRLQPGQKIAVFEGV